MSYLEKKAVGFAAAQTLCFHNEGIPFYENYMNVVNAVSDGDDPDNCVIFKPYENMEWCDVIAHIDAEADALLIQFKAVLKDAKNGIVQSAIDDTLDSDMNNLCMELMVDKGVNHGQ